VKLVLNSEVSEILFIDFFIETLKGLLFSYTITRGFLIFLIIFLTFGLGSIITSSSSSTDTI
tara:strand:- start:1356 stop:1541 length:186 start_codon:yes stop_codon:yes gene_type:complete